MFVGFINPSAQLQKYFARAEISTCLSAHLIEGSQSLFVFSRSAIFNDTFTSGYENYSLSGPEGGVRVFLLLTLGLKINLERAV